MITLNGTTGITTPDLTSEAGLTVDGVSFASGAPANTLVTTSGGNVGIGTSSPTYQLTVQGIGQQTANLTDAGSKGGSLYIQATAVSGGSGGAVLFGTTFGSGTPFAAIKGHVTNGDSNTVGDFAFSTRNAIADTALTERVRITSAGNVGIGTSSPVGNLNVNTTGNTQITISAGSTGLSRLVFQGQVSNNRGFIDYDNTSSVRAMIFRTNESEAARIDSSGNLLVGTATTPSSSGIGIGFQPGYSTSGTSMVTRSNTTSANDVIYFYNPNGLVGYVRTSGSSTSYVTSSDYRLKENVVGVTGASARVQQLNPVRFNFIADPDTTVDGFLAHEVQEVVPEAITGVKDAVNAEGNPEYQGIDQSKLVPLLTAALQEALTKIETLEARVVALEGN